MNFTFSADHLLRRRTSLNCFLNRERTIISLLDRLGKLFSMLLFLCRLSSRETTDCTAAASFRPKLFSLQTVSEPRRYMHGTLSVVACRRTLDVTTAIRILASVRFWARLISDKAEIVDEFWVFVSTRNRQWEKILAICGDLPVAKISP
jgi:hypothetical protein